MKKIELLYLILSKVLKRRKKNQVIKSTAELFKLYGTEKIRLSKLEKQKIIHVWNKVKINKRYFYHRFYKAHFGYFDERFVPTDIYSQFFENRLNPKEYSLFLQHKGMLKHFVPVENRPETIVSIINAIIFDENNVQITKEKAIIKLLNYDRFVVKPSVDSGGGKNVQIIHIDKSDKQGSTKSINDLFLKYGKDFICQKIIEQHEEFKRFNPDSINTIRIVTLNLNNKVSLLTAFFRIGNIGQIVDNVTSGGMFIGIKPDGYLHNSATNYKWEKILKSPVGIVFEGSYIDNYERIKNTVIEFHKLIPLASMIAWDVTVDNNNRVCIIEINLDSVDLVPEQFYNGPLFGDRTEEVIEYCLNNQQKPRFIF